MSAGAGDVEMVNKQVTRVGIQCLHKSNSGRVGFWISQAIFREQVYFHGFVTDNSESEFR